MKKYINYKDIKDTQKISFYYNKSKNKELEINEEDNPGKIDNSRLLVPLDEFVNNRDSHDQENIVIKPEMNQREDIVIVNKEIWNYLSSIFGGGPEIIRQNIVEKGIYHNSTIVEIFYRPVNNFIIIFIDYICYTPKKIRYDSF